MKKVLLFAAIIFLAAGQASAQKGKSHSGEDFRLSLGGELIIPTASDLTLNVGIGIGATIVGEFPISNDKFFATGAASFGYLFKKKDGSNIVILPAILVGARFYPIEKFYVGMGVGYARAATTGEKGGNSSAGGFAFRPELAYVFSESGEFNFKLTTFNGSGKDTNGFGATHVAFGIAYRF
jgi:hypothetical protein